MQDSTYPTCLRSVLAHLVPSKQFWANSSGTKYLHGPGRSWELALSGWPAHDLQVFVHVLCPLLLLQPPNFSAQLRFPSSAGHLDEGRIAQMPTSPSPNLVEGHSKFFWRLSHRLDLVTNSRVKRANEVSQPGLRHLLLHHGLALPSTCFMCHLDMSVDVGRLWIYIYIY